MRKNRDFTEEAFDKFLTWLNQNREQAWEKYIALHRRLVILFKCRGCFEAEDLADETINRVVRRSQAMADTYDGEPEAYFVAVAQNIWLEWLAAQRGREELPSDAPNPPDPDPENDSEYECLDECVQALTPKRRDLVLEYYRDEKRAKIDHRKNLADNLGIGLNALRIRAHRIRAELEQCIEQCLTGKTA